MFAWFLTFAYSMDKKVLTARAETGSQESRGTKQREIILEAVFELMPADHVVRSQPVYHAGWMNVNLCNQFM